MDNKSQFKIVLIGDSGVGKSCLFRRIQDNCFDGTNTKATIALDLIILKRYSKSLKSSYNVHLWDTAGQERYRSISSVFIQRASIFLMCFDLNNRKSFESIEQYWFPQIISSCANDKKIIVLVGCKNDVDTTNIKLRNDMLTFAQVNSLSLVLTSSKTQDKGELLKILIDKNMELLISKLKGDVTSINTNSTQLLNLNTGKGLCCT